MLTIGQFEMTAGHIFMTYGQFRKLGMITIIDFSLTFARSIENYV